MVSKKNCVPVDPERFKKILKERTLNIYEVSEEMGFSRKYLSEKIAGDKTYDPGLSKGDAIYLERIYGITTEDYAPLEKAPLPDTAVALLEVLDQFFKAHKDDLVDIIASAILQADEVRGQDVINGLKEDDGK